MPSTRVFRNMKPTMLTMALPFHKIDFGPGRNARLQNRRIDFVIQHRQVAPFGR